jgi:hypothetical protein
MYPVLSFAFFVFSPKIQEHKQVALPVSAYKHLSCAAFNIRLATSSGNTGTYEKHGRSRIRFRRFLKQLQFLKMQNGTLFSTLHPQKPQFRKISRYFTTLKQTVPPLFHNGSQISHSSEKVEVLANHFERSHHLTLHMGSHHHSRPKSYLTSHAEVRRHIFSLKPRTAPATTVYLRLCFGIYSHMLSFTSPSFLILFFNLATSPPSGKQQKLYQSQNLTNHQQMLLPIDLERIIASRLTAFVNRNHLLPEAQFGFRKQHSTVAQLARIAD